MIIQSERTRWEIEEVQRCGRALIAFMRRDTSYATDKGPRMGSRIDELVMSSGYTASVVMDAVGWLISEGKATRHPEHPGVLLVGEKHD